MAIGVVIGAEGVGCHIKDIQTGAGARALSCLPTDFIGYSWPMVAAVEVPLTATPGFSGSPSSTWKCQVGIEPNRKHFSNTIN